MIVEDIWLEEFLAPIAIDQSQRAKHFMRFFVLQIQFFIAPTTTIGFKQAINLVICYISNVYQRSTLLVHADHLSFFAFGVLMFLYFLFKERFLTVCAINSKKLAYLLMFLYILSRKDPITALHRAINRFFPTSLIMCLQLQNGSGCDAIFTPCFEYFHESIVCVGSFDELKLRCMTLYLQSLHLNMQELGFFPHQFSRQAPQKALSQLQQTQWGMGSSMRQTGQTTDCSKWSPLSPSQMISSWDMRWTVRKFLPQLPTSSPFIIIYKPRNQTVGYAKLIKMKVRTIVSVVRVQYREKSTVRQIQSTCPTYSSLLVFLSPLSILTWLVMPPLWVLPSLEVLSSQTLSSQAAKWPSRGLFS